MSDISSGGVSDAAAEAYLRRLAMSGDFGLPEGTAMSILNFLYRLERSDRTATRGAKEIADQSGSGRSLTDTDIRREIKKLRGDLAVFQKRNADPIEFDLPELPRGYKLIVRHASPIEANVKLLFNNRSHPENYLRKLLQEEGTDVLFVSICSEHTLRKLREWFKKRLIKAKHFRVLTWYPSSYDSIEHFASHLGEDPKDVASNIVRAWTGWKEIEESEWEKVEVYRYQSTPTMQAIVTANQIKLELLPFNAVNLHECGTTERRPALLLEHPSVSFEFFKDAFEDLWFTAMAAAKREDIVEGRWTTREKLLRERGLLGEGTGALPVATGRDETAH